MGRMTNMKNVVFCLFVVVLICVHATSTNAQETKQQTPTARPPLMNWLADSLHSQRYTVAISPLMMAFNSGVKLDFEMELARRGRWLLFSATGYYIAKPSDEVDVWNTFNSSFDDFSTLRGGGLGVFYKQMITNRGWYLNAGVLINFYDVGNYETRFISTEEDGLTYWRPKKAMFYTKYYKPMIQLNVGKYIPLSRRVFMDVSTGLGYAYSFYDKDKHNGLYDGMYGFAYRGVEWNFGFRIGGLLGRLY